MIKVKALCRIRYDGTLHKIGETFAVRDMSEVEGIAEFVENVKEPETPPATTTTPKETPAARRGRPKK